MALLGFTGFSWVLPGFRFYLVLPDFEKSTFYWVSSSNYGSYQVLLGFT